MERIFISFSIKNTSVADFFIELCNQLSEYYEVIIITDFIGVQSEKILPAVKIYTWTNLKQRNYKNIFFLIKMVLRFRPKIMISNFTSVNYFLIVGFLLGVKNRIAWCHSISGAFEVKRPVINRKKYIYSLATIIVANSKATKLDLINNFSVREEKIEVFYNAVEEKFIEKMAIDKSQILFVGNMSSSKGVGVLIEAMPEVLKSFPFNKLKLIGGDLKGKEIKRYRERAISLGIIDNVFFEGNRSRDICLKEFSKSYVTVVPSILEGFGYVVIESFSVKTPVVASNTTGIAEIMRDGIDGFLCTPGDSTDLAEKLKKIIGDKNMREEFSRNCYERFKNEFELTTSVKKIKTRLVELGK